MRESAEASEPYIQYIYQLIEQLDTGDLLIPKLQRELVWDWEHQAELLRSIRDGIPMGAIMVWRTTTSEVEHTEVLYGHKLQPPSERGTRGYLLDGMQRLSTLYAALRGPGPLLDETPEGATTFVYDLVKSSFERIEQTPSHMLNAESPEHDPLQDHNDPLLPLHALLDSKRLLKIQRRWTDPEADTWIERSDQIAKAFREYKVPVIPIASNDIGVAARTFQVINSQGVKMGETDMVHALTWSPGFELRTRIEELVEEHLEPLGWSAVDGDTVLKVVKASLGMDLQDRSATDTLSDALRRAPLILDEAVQSLAKAATFLHKECGIHAWLMVPYSTQAVLLAEISRQRLLEEIAAPLAAWFWVTTHGEMFSRMTREQVARALEDLRETSRDGRIRWSIPRPLELRAFPSNRSSFTSARIKGLALMLARKQHDAGLTPDPFRLLGDLGKDAFVHLLPRNRLSAGSYVTLGNRVLCHPDELPRLRACVLDGTVSAQELQAHIIPHEALGLGVVLGNWDSFIHHRQQMLAGYEKSFLDNLWNRYGEAPGA